MEKSTNELPRVSKNLPVSNVVTDRPHAPDIYFESVVTASHKAGVIGVTLVKQYPLAEGGILKIEQGVVGYIHGSIPATKELIAHLQAVVDDADREAALAAAPTGLRN